MDEYEIDTYTGLPVLPEGYRWFVSEISPTVRGILHKERNAWYTMEIQVCTPTKTETRSYRTFWGRKRYYTSEIRKEYWSTINSLPIWEEEILLPGILRNVATQLLDKFIVDFEEDARKKRIARSNEAMLGAYPPNRVDT